MNSVVAPPPAILVVAARPSELMDVAEALRDEGCPPLAVGAEERELERAATLGPAVILLDAEARPDAFALCRRLKTGAGTRDIPVILILPGTDADGRAAALAAGAADCLTRPLVREEALARIRPHLRLATVERQLNARNGELERLRAEHSAELQSSAELLRLKSCALSHVREAVELIDSEGRFRYVNEEACRALGYSAPELLGMRVPDIDPNWTTDAFAEQWQRLAAAGTLRLESRHRRKDGPLFDVEIVANHFTYHGREYCLSLVRDITEQRQTKRELGLLTSAIDQVRETIYLLDKDSRIRYLNEEACRKLGYSAEELIGMRLEKIDPAVLPAVYCQYWQELVAAERWHGESFHYRRDGSRFPIEVEARLIEHDGEPFCLCYVTDLTDRKKTERELRLLDQAVNQSTEAAFLMDALGKFVYVNEAACRSLGYSREELLAMSVFDIDALLKPETIRTSFCQTLAGKVPKGTLETLHRRRDGSVFPVELSSSVVESDDARYILSLVRDITERKRAQRELLLLEQAVNRSQEAVFLMNTAGRFIYVNEAACRSLGYRRDELLRMGPPDLDADMAPEVLRQLSEDFFARGPTRGRVESRHRRRDGSVFPVEISASLFEHAGEKLCLTLVRDITERKEAERRLHASEQAFRALVENSPDTIVRYDSELKRIYANPAMLALAGQSAEEFIGRTPERTALLPSPQSYMGELREVLKTGKESSIEGTSLTPTGETRWGHIRFVPERAPDGTVVSVLAVGRDIHDLKSREQQFRTLAENSPNIITRYDRAGRRLYVNPAVVRLWGRPAEQMLGSTPFDNTAIIDVKAFVDAINRVFESGKTISFEMEHYDAAGERGWNFTTLVPEFGADGRVGTVLAIGHDITEIKKSELRFRTLAENLPENIIRHDRQGRMVYVNPRMLKTWRRTSAEGVLGKTLIEAFGHEASHRYHPLHMKVMETREPLTYDYTVRDAGDGNGERIHEIHVVPECNEAGEVVGALAIGRDITRRRKTERELALLDRAVNQSHDAFFLIDLDMRLRYVNDAAVRGLGYGRDELLGMKLPAIDPYVDPVQLREWMRQTAAAGQFPGTIETCHRAKDGRIFPVEVSAASIDYDGDILYLTVARDIGERKRAERERQEHVRFLETMDRINDAIREAAGMDRMTSAVLDIVLALFECDRAFLIHPCDPDAEAWQVPFERTRPEYPGAGSENAIVPMDATAADAMRRQLEADGPLAFGPGNELPLPETAERFGFRSFMSMALRPAIGKPWLFGLQQCSRERAWTAAERRLLQEIGRRLEDGLTGMLAHGILRDSELRYREIFQNATDAIMIWDVTPEGRFRLLDVNPVWEKLTGADHRRMAGLCLDDIDRNAAARGALVQLRACLASAAPLSYEDGLKTPTGEWRLHTTLVPVADAAGRIYRVVSIGRDITAQKRAEVRLRESYAMLQELAAHRDSAREEERTRIAREIHDELGQHLTALRMGISTVGFEFRDSQPLLVERVQRLTGLADQTIKVVRNVAAALRPAVLDSGVAAALEWLVSEFQRHTGIACSVSVQESLPRIDAYRAVALFRIVQESLTNVARHAKAKALSVSLRQEEGSIILETADDGCGFDPEGPRSRSFGLTGMRERALMLGGEIAIESRPGNGTAVRLIIPLDSEKAPT